MFSFHLPTISPISPDELFFTTTQATVQYGVNLYLITAYLSKYHTARGYYKVTSCLGLNVCNVTCIEQDVDCVYYKVYTDELMYLSVQNECE